MWLIKAIGWRENGEIDRVLWQNTNPNTNTWLGKEEVVSVDAVTDEIRAGNKVGTHFSEGGGTVLGTEVRVVAGRNGRETIEARTIIEGRRLSDLPQL